MKRVYFLKPIGMAGPIKIGCSVAPESRLKSLDIWSPFPLELLASASGGNSDEARLHWRFRKDRSHGEWFFVSVELLNLIDHVRLNDALPPLEAVPRYRSSRRSRNLEWRAQKTALGRRLNKAEAWAYGWLTYLSREARPAHIQALRDKCAGVHQPPLSGDDLAQIEAYITHLHAQPDGRTSEREKALRIASDAKWAAHNARVRASREAAA